MTLHDDEVNAIMIAHADDPDAWEPPVYVPPSPDHNGGPCPYCDRIMSIREKIAQGCCNDCYGGAR